MRAEQQESSTKGSSFRYNEIVQVIIKRKEGGLTMTKKTNSLAHTK